MSYKFQTKPNNATEQEFSDMFWTEIFVLLVSENGAKRRIAGKFMF